MSLDVLYSCSHSGPHSGLDIGVYSHNSVISQTVIHWPFTPLLSAGTARPARAAHSIGEPNCPPAAKGSLPTLQAMIRFLGPTTSPSLELLQCLSTKMH